MTVKLGSSEESSSGSGSASSSSAAKPVSTIGSASEVVVALSEGLKTNAESYKGLQSAGNRLASGLGAASDALDVIGDELDAIEANVTVAEDEDSLLSDIDRRFLQADTNARLAKIDSLASSTQYKGSNALDGSLSLDVNLTVNSEGGNTVAVESAESSNLLDGNTLNLSTSANATTSAGYVEDALTLYNQINGTVKETITTGTSSAKSLGALAGSSSGTADALTNYVNPVDAANQEIGEQREGVSNFTSALAEAAALDTVSGALESISIKPIDTSTTEETDTTDTTTADTAAVSTYAQSVKAASSATSPQKSVVDITA